MVLHKIRHLFYHYLPSSFRLFPLLVYLLIRLVFQILFKLLFWKREIVDVIYLVVVDSQFHAFYSVG